jgi:hypothetical protein
MTTLTSEELAEIEKRDDLYERYEDREPMHMICDRIADDRAALLAHLRSQTPPQAVTDQVERRDDLHNVIARIMKRPVYNSSEISDAVEQYLERLPASPTAPKGEA